MRQSALIYATLFKLGPETASLIRLFSRDSQAKDDHRAKPITFEQSFLRHPISSPLRGD